MMESGLHRFVQITDINDDFLLPWLDLYETAFAPAERILVSNQLELLKRRAAGEASHNYMLAALNAHGALIGLLQYQILAEADAAFLWYMALQVKERNRGLGTQMYSELWDRLDSEACRDLVFEVEIPEQAESQEDRRVAERRIAFYQRQGAQLLGGVQYMQSVGWHQPPMPMHIMVHHRDRKSPQAAYDLAKAVFGDSITQVGPLSLN
jgi:ribosomal protein S18 acetylase RimI-like enzyme